MNARLAVAVLLLLVQQAAGAGQPLNALDSVVHLDRQGVILLGDFATPAQALAAAQRVAPSMRKVPADAGVVWGYLAVQNNTSHTDWALLTTNHLYQSITVYRHAASGEGLRQLPAMQAAPRASSLLQLPVEIGPGESVELLIRMQSAMMHAPYLRLQSQQSATDLAARFSLVTVLCLGALAALLIYNGFLAIALRSGLYGVYCVYLIAHGAFMLLASGVMFWLVPDLPMALTQARPWALLSGAAMVWFAWQFIGGRNIPSVLRVVLLAQLIVMLILGAYSLAMPSTTGATARPYILVFMGTMLCIVVAAAVHWRRGAPAAGIFLLAWSVLVASYVYSAVSLSIEEWRTIWTNIAPLFGGTIEMLLLSLALAQTIARQRSRADALAAESAQKSAFIATLTHEIRTPLHAILATMREANDAARNTPAQAAVGRGHDACEGLFDLVDGLVDHTRIAVSPKLQDVPFRLRPLVDSVTLLFAARAQHANVELDTSRIEDVAVVGPAVVVRRALINLLGNAIKYAGPGKVLVTAAVVNDGAETRLRLQVVDTGIGMPADHPALQGRASKANPTAWYAGAPSSGLGLLMTHELLQAANGYLQIESAIGQGTTATVFLPVTQQLAGLMAPGTPEDSAGAEVWLADDDAASRAVIKGMQINGVSHITAFETGSGLLDALNHAVRLPIAVLLDMRLGAERGLDVLDEIRASTKRGVATLPCVVTSAGLTPGDVQCAMLRCATTLQKPFDGVAASQAVRLAQAIMRAAEHLRRGLAALDPTAFREAASIFLDQAKQDLHQILTQADRARRKNAAHRLLSAAAALGLDDVAAAARSAEGVLAEQDQALDTAELETAMQAAIVACRALCDSEPVVPSAA